MKSPKEDLQVVTKELKALARKTEKLMRAFDKLEKAQAAKKRRVKTKAKTKKRASAARTGVRKATARKPAARRAAPKKASAKKAAPLTATNSVLKIIKSAKKGIDAPTLMKKTGFADKKIRNILMRASKQGKIKRASRGVYVAA
jgi:uncharacterized protein YdiU (UPF0061 family)